MANYFYVKSSLGTRTSGGGTTRQTGAFGSGSLTAANVYASVYDAINDSTTPPTSGDIILCSDAHDNVITTSTTWAIPSGVLIESVSDTNCDTYSRGAIEECSTAAGYYLKVYNASIGGNASIHGLLLLNSGSGTNAQIGGYNGGTVIFDDCELSQNRSANTGSALLLYGTSGGGKSVFKNCVFDRTAVGQKTTIDYNSIFIKGGSFGSSAQVTYAFNMGTSNRICFLDADGLDMSAGLSASGYIGNAGASAYASIIAKIRNCKLPTGFTSTGALFNGTLYGDHQRVELVNCDDGNTDYKVWAETGNGTITDDTGTYVTAGAVFNGQNLSHYMAGNTNATYSGSGLVSLPMQVPVTSTGSKTFTVELLTDGQLTDNDVVMDITYLGDSSYPLSTFAGTQPSFVATATNLTAGTGTANWTGYATGTSGLTTPTSSKLSKTVTINQKGAVLVFIRITNNVSMYVDPIVTVA